MTPSALRLRRGTAVPKASTQQAYPRFTISQGAFSAGCKGGGAAAPRRKRGWDRMVRDASLSCRPATAIPYAWAGPSRPYSSCPLISLMPPMLRDAASGRRTQPGRSSSAWLAARSTARGPVANRLLRPPSAPLRRKSSASSSTACRARPAPRVHPLPPSVTFIAHSDSAPVEHPNLV